MPLQFFGTSRISSPGLDVGRATLTLALALALTLALTLTLTPALTWAAAL